MVCKILFHMLIAVGCWCVGYLLTDIIKNAVKNRRIKKRLADGKVKKYLK